MAFDLGLPGLGLDLSGAQVNLTSDFSFDVSVCVNRNSGAYFYFNPANANDLTLGVRA